MTVRNRLMVGPMERAMANPDGTLTDRYIDYMRERAKGGAALIQLESTFVDLGGRGNPYQVGCHDDIVIPGLARMADTLHEHGARLAMELHHGGRQASPTASGRQPIAPSAIPSTFMGPGAIPRAMTKEDIDFVIDCYVKAAERCLKAGVDMIHLHGAHGYLLGQFLSPRSNQREDEYGGSRENRARFPLEVLAAVRAVAGPDYPIGYRISAVEFLDGGLEIEDSVAFSVMLADAGIDIIDVAGGTYESLSAIFQGPRSPKGGFVPFAAAIKKAVGDRVPVGVAQRLNDPEFSDHVMEEHNIDFISLTRAFHADPHYVRKLERGKAEDILPCIACNACLWMTVQRIPAACAANPHSNFEQARRIHRARTPKRVLVVGGGVSGMQSARILARQGHEVTLVEQTDRLGGQIKHSRVIQPDHGDLADWLERQLASLGVKVLTGQKADVGFLKEQNPDSIIVATGATGAAPRFPITGGSVPVMDLFAALEQPLDTWRSPWAGRVAITTGDAASCYTAIHLASNGFEVHVIEASGGFAADRPVPTNGMLAEMLEATPGIHLHADSTVESLDGRVLEVQQRGEHFTLDVDTVIVGGRISNYALMQDLKRAGIRASVRAVGDAVRTRDVFFASSDAADAAADIEKEIALQLVSQL